jgi:general transcription factor 3C polypeptide 5 (transcription factor C subunit 1)
VLEHKARSVDTAKTNYVNPVAGVCLRPDDPFAKKLSSTATQTQNVLIKVTVPKRTGRKRKRGSDEPFSESADISTYGKDVTAPELLQRLRDNEDSYSLQAVGIIQDTHRFSDLPDFQVSADDVPVMRELRAHAMEPDYDKLKAFNISFNPEINSSSVFPGPPSFLKSGQAALISAKTKTGEHDYSDSQKPNSPKPAEEPPSQPAATRPASAYKCKTLTEQSVSLAEELPRGPSPSLPKQMGGTVKPAMDALEEIFKERSIVSVRTFNSLHPGHTPNSLKAAIPHIGYYMNAGPWARTIAKFGVDPRQDPSMRAYQTIIISAKGIATADTAAERVCEAAKTHVFDGTRIATSGNSSWQLCDLTDPTLQHIVQTDDIRAECELEQWGWYHNGTIAKIRVILRDKMMRIANNQEQVPDEGYMALATQLPNHIKEVSDCDASLFGDKIHLRTMCSAIARDAVYRNRETTNGYSSNRGDLESPSADVDERVDGTDYGGGDGYWGDENGPSG